MKKTFWALALVMLMVASFTLSACGNTTTEDGFTIPVGMKQISPDTADYYLFINEDWKEDISTGVVTAYYSDNDPTNVAMMVFSLDASMTYSEYWDSYEKEFSAVYSDYELIDESETLLDGVTSGRFVYTGTFGDAETTAEGETPNAVKYKFTTVVTIKGRSIYLLTYSARENMYDEHFEDFSDVLLNFKFKK